MKLDAHPLVVAVALGLLGPGALEAEDDEESSCASCGSPENEYEPGSEPDTDEIERIEHEWSKLR